MVRQWQAGLCWRRKQGFLQLAETPWRVSAFPSGTGRRRSRAPRLPRGQQAEQRRKVRENDSAPFSSLLSSIFVETNCRDAFSRSQQPYLELNQETFLHNFLAASRCARKRSWLAALITPTHMPRCQRLSADGSLPVSPEAGALPDRALEHGAGPRSVGRARPERRIEELFRKLQYAPNQASDFALANTKDVYSYTTQKLKEPELISLRASLK